MTYNELRRLDQLIPFRQFEPPTHRAYKISIAVLRKFLGSEWTTRHVENATSGFLKRDPSTSLALETHHMRTTLLAEMLYNLQIADQFDSCLLELAAGQVESTYAALEAARMLATIALDRNLVFKFIKPSRRIGRSYDIGVLFSDDVRACIEAKCKLEETEITLNTIKRSLSDAASQLPKTIPGIIFVKIPRFWLDDETFALEINRTAYGLFGISRRVVSVVFYTATVIYERDLYGETVGEIMAYREVHNSKHKFKKLKERSWEIFPDDPPTQPPGRINYNGMPTTWQRLFGPIK